jgi:hypothetical protein
MITSTVKFDERVVAALMTCDPVVVEYREFFDLLDWSRVPERDEGRPWPGSPPHPQQAYVKALLVKICEKLEYITDLRKFLVKHPLLVLELGFRPVLDPSQPFGFNVERTVPCDRWLRHKQQTLDNAILQEVLKGTVRDLQAEIPGLGETVSTDVKHIYAWVKENNLKDYVANRYDPARQPRGDPDCRLGVKRSSNQEKPGSQEERKEYLWGYGTGIVAATNPRYGDVVLAELTQPFNEADISYFKPLQQQMVDTLAFHPTNLAADAAYDAWYVYQPFAERGGMAAIPLNPRGHAVPQLGPHGIHLCPQGVEMVPSYAYDHTQGYRAQLLRCPLLFPNPTGQTCSHKQFAKGVGCVKHINIEPGGRMRIALDRTSETYKAIYNQRTASERINSQAKALGIERPKVRNIGSVCNLNTLTYIVINARALQRVRALNARPRAPTPSLC